MTTNYPIIWPHPILFVLLFIVVSLMALVFYIGNKP